MAEALAPPFSSYKPPSPEPPTPPLPNALSASHSTNPIIAPPSVLTPVAGGPPPPPPASAAAPPAVSFAPAPPIIQFDPTAGSDDEDDEEGRPKKKWKAGGAGTSAAGEGGEDEAEKSRRKIDIAYIQKKEKRHITFSKRKAGIMKKAYELATLTGTQVLLLVVSETGIVYTFTTAKFQPLVGAGPGGNPSEGQRLIQACLAVDPNDGSDYISPPPDGPLLPLPPSAINRPFEANSSIHGGQIALRTRTHRPGASQRSKPRPASIRTSSDASIISSLPTPVDNMLLSPAARHNEYTPLPSVLQGSVGPRGEQIQSTQEYEAMMLQQQQQRGSPMQQSMYSNMPLQSPASRMDGGYPMDYSLPSPHRSAQQQYSHPHSSPSHHMHSSPMQQQQHQHLQQQRMAEQQQMSPSHRRQYSDEGRHDPRMYSHEQHDRGHVLYSNPPLSAGAVFQQQMGEDQYLRR